MTKHRGLLVGVFIRCSMKWDSVLICGSVNVFTSLQVHGQPPASTGVLREALGGGP